MPSGRSRIGRHIPTTAGSRTAGENRIGVPVGTCALARTAGLLARTAARTTRQARKRCITTNSTPNAHASSTTMGVHSTAPDATADDPANAGAAVNGWLICVSTSGTLVAGGDAVADIPKSAVIDGPSSDAPTA